MVQSLFHCTIILKFHICTLGIAEFSMYEWIREGFYRCCRRGPPPAEQIVVTPNTPAMNTMAAQLTEDNEDFAERGRYHQSEIVKGENFDDYDE